MKKLTLLLAIAALAYTGCKKDDNNIINPGGSNDPTPIEKTLPGVVKATVTQSKGDETNLTVNLTYLGNDTTTSISDWVKMFYPGTTSGFSREVTNRKASAQFTITGNKFAKGSQWTVYVYRKYPAPAATDTLLTITGKW